MNGFLVLLCHTMDDLPIGLFATEAEAKACAAETGPDAPNDHPLGWDCTTPVCVKIVEFADGKPISAELAKSFDED